MMVRGLSLFAMSAGFLAISPALRQSLMEKTVIACNKVASYGPFGYIMFALVLVVAFGISLSRSIRPRG